MTDAPQLRFGRKPPKNAPALMLGPLLTGVVPAHPASEDYLAELSGWKMLGNDQYGDCVAVTWANERRLVSAVIGVAEEYPSLDAVETVYKTQNPAFPAEDDGMDIQTLLEWLTKNEPPDSVQAVAFAKVDASNLDEVKAALAIFGCVWTGIVVQSENMSDFDAGQPWEYRAGDSIDGGHSVISGGYAGVDSSDVKFVTWAQETSFTDGFWQHQVEEAWVVIWPEHLGSKEFLAGIDQQALASAYTQLTGRPFPAEPTPAPTPEPVPPPDSDPADVALANMVRAWSQKHHVGLNREAAQAVRVWLEAKGLE